MTNDIIWPAEPTEETLPPPPETGRAVASLWSRLGAFGLAFYVAVTLAERLALRGVPSTRD